MRGFELGDPGGRSLRRVLRTGFIPANADASIQRALGWLASA
jgi:hypothetical protein